MSTILWYTCKLQNFNYKNYFPKGKKSMLSTTFDTLVTKITELERTIILSIDLHWLLINHGILFSNGLPSRCQFGDSVLWKGAFHQFGDIFGWVTKRRNSIINAKTVHEITDGISNDGTSIFTFGIGNISTWWRLWSENKMKLK